MLRKQTCVTLKTMPLKDCVELTHIFDQLCFPKEMWLDNCGMVKLIKSGAESTILSVNDRVIGQAITIVESAMEDELKEVDFEFLATNNGIYSYSEAILPSHQKYGYGGLLLHEIALRMKIRGFQSISAHVRRKNGWDIKRKRVLQVFEERPLNNFWMDKSEAVTFQRAVI